MRESVRVVRNSTEEINKINEQVQKKKKKITKISEIIDMVRRNGVDPQPYLEKKFEKIKFDTYEDLILSLNDYVDKSKTLDADISAELLISIFLLSNSSVVSSFN